MTPHTLTRHPLSCVRCSGARSTTAGRPEKGQSLVEFSLLMVFLVVLLMGLLDLGRAYFTYLALKDAAAEGAYFGSVFPQCVDADGVDVDGDGLEDDGAACAGDHNVLHRVQHSAVQGGLVDWNSATITTNAASGYAYCTGSRQSIDQRS